MISPTLILLAMFATPLPQEGPQLPPLPPGSEDREQARKEMVELFGKVETRLKEIDALLYDASSGRPSLAGSEDDVIGELLKKSSGRSTEVLEGIDRILEIAEQMGQSQGSGSGSNSVEQAMSEQSPLDGQSDQPKGQKESTPEVGQEQGPEPKGQNNDQQQQQQEQERPGESEGGGQSNSPKESNSRPDNRDASSSPPSGETGRIQVTDTTERWGDLPVHVRDLFRSEGGRDMPPEYRDWIDSYYRRLNQRP